MHLSLTVSSLIMLGSYGLGQQIAVNRIEQMPNKPSPYLMRNWKAVARQIDSLAFDFNRSGQYLPLGEINAATLNYPAHSSFRLHTVVGTTVPILAEAITTLPAVVGASLAGIDKSNQLGTNWVLMCEEWFNKKNGTNLYLNHPNGATGDDWWYETMPNVFFYQLFDLYPSVGDFKNQFGSVADRWLEAVRRMGGVTTPWSVPNMDHRAWNFATQSANDDGVREPEAAGAIAWLLYQAYVETGQTKYRVGAELTMEFLNRFSTNPSYEIQMPYGVYVAERMNAELGTDYDVAKMLNWCFDVGPLRSWGAMAGTWGGYDCSGLIGEVSSNEYAFAMNTFETVGALVPLVRYDDRFARAIGKWVLNAANASRLFYSDFLPDANQDGASWAHQYDTHSSIAHEAIHRFALTNSAITPYATGDAVRGGWGATNFAVYASSHVGILGGIIDTTNVPGILRLDVLKTDYFHANAFPTYLYSNLDSIPHSVTMNVGNGAHDLYDGVTNSFLAGNVSGNTEFTIPPNTAALIVVTPAGGVVSYELDKTLVDGVIIDYHSGKSIANYPPRIKSTSADSSLILTYRSIQLYCTAADRNNDTLAYAWSVSAGAISGLGEQVTWTSPETACTAFITCEVNDGHGGIDRDTVVIQVAAYVNHPPVIQKIRATPRKLDLQSASTISCIAFDQDGDLLTYNWSTTVGNLSGSGTSVSWTSPALEGNYSVVCRVEDGHGGVTTDSVRLEVRDFSKHSSGQLVAFYPFTGDATDASGNHHDGVLNGVAVVPDRFGISGNAFAFDGISSSVRIPNDSALNFQNAISVNFWLKMSAQYTSREQYVISHGNWQNRWKVSINPVSNKLRWTVKTSAGIKDLDSETSIALDSLYNVTVLYSGADIEVYLNRELDAFTTFAGAILQTSIDLVVGQALPSDNEHNFNGVLDELRIYNYPLSTSQISSLYDLSTSVATNSTPPIPKGYELEQNFPNPFNPSTMIKFTLPISGQTTMTVHDVLGRAIKTLVDGELEAGSHSVIWNAEGYASGVYFCVMRAGSVALVKPMELIR